MTVEAVQCEVKGSLEEVPTVCLQPFLPILFCCGELTCEDGTSEKMRAWLDWATAVNLTRNKLFNNQCDYCFKLADNVHRWPNSICSISSFKTFFLGAANA